MSKRTRPHGAYAYYRCANRDEGDDPIGRQKREVAALAEHLGVEIVREFTDECKSGLTLANRPGILEMLESCLLDADLDCGYVLLTEPVRFARSMELSDFCELILRSRGKRVMFADCWLPRKERDERAG